MASQQSQRWGYVQQPTDYQQQHQQLGRPDNNPSSSALERLASSNSSFTAVVSTVGNDMLPLSSSSSSSCSSSSSVSDTDASAMEAMKVDPLDLTCNSQSISRSSPTSGGATGHRNRNDSAPAVLDYEDQSSSVAQASGSISSGCNNRTPLFGLDDDERTDHQQQQRPNHRLMGTTAVVAGTGTQQASAVSVATPATTGVVAPPAPAAAITGGEEAHRCDMCGKTFAVPARLTRHYRTHTGERPFVCEVCGKSFSVKENLSVHRRIHTKEKPYRCPHCGRGFEHSGKLHRHMRIHTGERPHQCTDCGKTFIQSGQLVIHMRSHTGEKPYVCTVCSKGFTCSKQLKVHSRTHTGERPYACDVCGKTFAYNHVLKLHQMAHLGERLYKCTICSETYSSKKTLEAHIKMHGVSPTRQSPIPSTSSVPVAVPTSNSISQQHVRPGGMATANDHHHLGRRLQGRHSTGVFIDNNQTNRNSRLGARLGENATERISNHQQPSLSPSSAESNGSSPSDMDAMSGPSASNNTNNNNLLLMEAQRHFPIQQHPAGLSWNVLNNLALSRAATIGHHLAQSREYEDSQQQVQQQPMSSSHQQDRSHFAYPQLLNATRSGGLAVQVDSKRLAHHLQQQQPFKNQSTVGNNHPTGSVDYSPMTYLRPMPPLIPVTAAGPLLAASPTSLRTLERHPSVTGHSSAGDSLAAVPPALRPLDGSATTHGPPRKSSRFRGGEGSGSAGDGGCNSESSDSPPSSASSSPSLMLTDVAASDSQSAHPLSDGLRSTSVIRFAHRPSSSSSPPSSK